MLLPDGSLTNNAGTMHTQSTAECLDALTTSLASVASMSERRTARLLDPVQNGGLAAFLVHPGSKPGVNSGLMIRSTRRRRSSASCAPPRRPA